MQHSTSSEACGSSQADSTSSTHLFHPEFPLHGPSTSTSHTVPSVRSFTVSLLGPGFVPKVLGGRRWTQNSPPSGFNWLSNRQTMNLSASSVQGKARQSQNIIDEQEIYCDLWALSNAPRSVAKVPCQHLLGCVCPESLVRPQVISLAGARDESGPKKTWVPCSYDAK